jgi:hypothetical protein
VRVTNITNIWSKKVLDFLMNQKLYNNNNVITTALTGKKSMNCKTQPENEEGGFVEFRRKVRSAEVLSAAMEQLLRMLQFTGKVSVVVQNGRVLKSGYEEGYFRQPPLT